MLDKNSKIYIAGHHGLVGSAIWNNLKQRGYNNLIGRSHSELDLTDQTAVKKFFDEERPDAVVWPGVRRRHNGQLPLPRRLHHAEHANAVQCDRQCLLAWREKTVIPRFDMYISKGCTTADERRCAAHITIGIQQ